MKHIKEGHEYQTICDKCGTLMPFKATVIMNNAKRNCPKCGTEYFVETPQIDWEKVAQSVQKC